MKLLQLLTIVFSIFVSNLCFGEEEKPSLDAVPTLDVVPIKEIKNNEINFDALSRESKIGNLSELVKDKVHSSSQASSMRCLLDAIRMQTILYPYSEGLAYVNGVLCHVGNYPQSIIYTVLEGPHYGLQTITDYNGSALYINYDYFLEYTLYGVVLHHHYSDSEVITGSNQMIIFY